MKRLLAISLILLTLAGSPVEAARSFNGTTDKIVTTTVPVTVLPVTMCAWVFTGVSGVSQDIAAVNLANNPSNGSGFQLRIHTTNSLRARACDNAICSAATSTATIATSTWTQVCAVFTSTTSRTPYVNGTGGPTDSTSVANPTTPSETSIGASAFNSVYSNWVSGRIADVGIWNAALTQAEITSLSKGFIAPMVRPNNLVMWVPMNGGNVLDRQRGASFTLTGTSAVDHPPLFWTY